jgi:Holliday junction DNA helicase RuvA
LYHHLRGELVLLTPTSAVIETSGLGFDLRIPLSTYEALKGRKEAVILTHLHVREDDLRLFGFATEGELELFRLLLSVSGVGPSIALASLSTLAPGEVAAAIADGDLKTLQRIKGVGKKLAERLTVELRDRAGAIQALPGAGGGAAPRTTGESTPRDLLRIPEVADTARALVTLGFDRKSAGERAAAAYSALKARLGNNGPVDAEQLIKECLRSS